MPEKDADVKKIMELIRIMKENDLVKIDIQHGDDRISLQRAEPPQPIAATSGNVSGRLKSAALSRIAAQATQRRPSSTANWRHTNATATAARHGLRSRRVFGDRRRHEVECLDPGPSRGRSCRSPAVVQPPASGFGGGFPAGASTCWRMAPICNPSTTGGSVVCFVDVSPTSYSIGSSATA